MLQMGKLRHREVRQFVLVIQNVVESGFETYLNCLSLSQSDSLLYKLTVKPTGQYEVGYFFRERIKHLPPSLRLYRSAKLLDCKHFKTGC